MATTTRQSSLLVNQDWTKVYESFRAADFQAYDFQTLRKAMLDYLRLYYPEDFNDYTESSEYIALIDLIAFMGQSLAFRTDLNARENFIDTAERRDSILKLARLISYVPKRNQTATGFLKFDSVQTTEQITDSNGLDLSNFVVTWNDNTNPNWYEQFVTVLNAALPVNQNIGNPANSAEIGSIQTDEYNVNIPPGTIPVYGFSSQVENASMSFEVVSATSQGQSYVYESSPQVGKPFNILYRNDSLGNSSNNTGFFFYFKQGTLQNLTFNLTESIPNNLVNVNTNNINNTDVWLYELNNQGLVRQEWNKIPSVNGVNIIYNNNAPRKSFQVTTRNNDQIDLVFGDGTFSAIPQGTFRTYFRTSTGLSYKITPDNMRSIAINIPYVSRANRLETLTIVASLKYTVANATARESNTEIKSKAPQQYYTQNRMVTGEDYNIFPYTYFNTISKVKAVNRSSSGVSRYLDVLDTTGRYSSTNIFADDGVLYEEDSASSFDFTWSTTNDINRIINNNILPIIRGKPLLHFYYDNFNRFSLTDLYWSRTTLGSGSSTGYFKNSAGTAQQVGSGVSNNNLYITENSLIIFTPGSGKYFNTENQITDIPASGVIPQNGRSELYVTVTRLVGNGAQGTLSDGSGAVSLSQNVPTDAIAATVIPAFSNSFSDSFITQIVNLISSYSEFGIRYNQRTQTYAVVTAQDIDLTGAFSQTNEGSESGLNLDSSWLLSFSLNDTVYTVSSRGLSYIIQSVSETKFYFDDSFKIFDSTTGLTVNDSVNILKVNGDPDTGSPYTNNILWYIYGQIAESDGYVDGSKALVTYSDADDDGVPDNPDIFDKVVQPTVNPLDKYVYLQKTYGYDSFVTYQILDNTLVVDLYPTQASIQPNINDYPVGQIFYAYTDKVFYVITGTTSARTLTASTDYLARTGRQDLYFQYRHNAPAIRRLDPSPNNLIDLYILTKEYETLYRSWALDTTGTVIEPEQPDNETLRLAYAELEDYKSISDALIYNSATFKPLFGTKASPELQATFKVIKNPNIGLSDSEIRSQVLASINNYFAINNWDFGETFYFTELATYIQQGLAPAINSIIIVPNSTNQTYGSLQQISSEPNEILISVATVDNIEVITSITAAQLNLENQAVNTIIN
jgi:hypothetical protein